MMMIRKAFFHPNTSTIDPELNRETIADQSEDVPTKLDTVIKYLVIIIMFIMASFIIWNLNMFQHLQKGPFQQISLPTSQETRCEQVDQD